MDARRPLEKYAALWAFMCLFFLYVSDAHALSGLSEQYNPRKIGKVSGATPGHVAWSPDGTRISYISKVVYIYDTETGKKRKSKIKDAYFIQWISNNRLSVLFKEPEHKWFNEKNGEHVRYSIGVVDVETLEVERTALKERPHAVYPLTGEKSLLIMTFEAESTKIGTKTTYGLIRHELESGASEEIYSSSATQFGKYSLHSLSGWIIAGLNPIDSKAIYFEYRDPPALRPYLRVKSVDYISGELSDMGRIDNKVIYTQGSRSPNGSRIALTDREGHLNILEVDASLSPVDVTLEGQYPSWNPGGSQIFFGGYLVDSDGKNLKEIIGHNPESIAWWSPDGRRLVTLIDEELWLLEGFEPYFVPPDSGLGDDTVDRARKLRNLLDEGLIDEKDYEERYRKLLNNGNTGEDQ